MHYTNNTSSDGAIEVTTSNNTKVTNPQAISSNTNNGSYDSGASVNRNLSNMHVEEFIESLGNDFFLKLRDYKFVDIRSISFSIKRCHLVELISIAEARATLFDVLTKDDLDDIQTLYSSINGIVIACDDKLKNEAKEAIRDLQFYRHVIKPKDTFVNELPKGENTNAVWHSTTSVTSTFL